MNQFFCQFLWVVMLMEYAKMSIFFLNINTFRFENYLQSKEIEEDHYVEKESNYMELKTELELTFVKIMEEEIQLERNCDQERSKI